MMVLVEFIMHIIVLSSLIWTIPNSWFESEYQICLQVPKYLRNPHILFMFSSFGWPDLISPPFIASSYESIWWKKHTPRDQAASEETLARALSLWVARTEKQPDIIIIIQTEYFIKNQTNRKTKRNNYIMNKGIFLKRTEDILSIPPLRGHVQFQLGHFFSESTERENRGPDRYGHPSWPRIQWSVY